MNNKLQSSSPLQKTYCMKMNNTTSLSDAIPMLICIHLSHFKQILSHIYGYDRQIHVMCPSPGSQQVNNIVFYNTIRDGGHC